MSRRNTPKTCPLCHAAVEPAFTPFCSRGCRDRDLLKWLGDGYAVPGRPLDEEQAEGLDRGEHPPL